MEELPYEPEQRNGEQPVEEDIPEVHEPSGPSKSTRLKGGLAYLFNVVFTAVVCLAIGISFHIAFSALVSSEKSDKDDQHSDSPVVQSEDSEELARQIKTKLDAASSLYTEEVSQISDQYKKSGRSEEFEQVLKRIQEETRRQNECN